MFCVKCGVEVPGATKFCYKCGYNLELPVTTQQEVSQVFAETQEVAKVEVPPQEQETVDPETFLYMNDMSMAEMSIYEAKYDLRDVTTDTDAYNLLAKNSGSCSRIKNVETHPHTGKVIIKGTINLYILTIEETTLFVEEQMTSLKYRWFGFGGVALLILLATWHFDFEGLFFGILVLSIVSLVASLLVAVYIGSLEKSAIMPYIVKTLPPKNIRIV